MLNKVAFQLTRSPTHLTPADSATDVLLPLEVQPVLPIESPVAPIGEVLPPVGWRGESVHPFGVDERLGRGDPNITPANLKQEYERQQQNQARELGEKDQANLTVVIAVLAADERYGTSVSEATYANLARFLLTAYDNPAERYDAARELALVFTVLDVPVSLLEEIAGFAELDDLAIGRDALDYLMRDYRPQLQASFNQSDDLSAHAFALDFWPIIGDAKGLLEVFTGNDLLTGEGLGALRWAGLLGLSEIRQLRHLNKLPLQLHHFATNKNIRYTARMEEIAQSFGLSLNGRW